MKRSIRELKESAWRSPETNVLYSIHCTVQYHDGAVKKNRVDFSAVVIKVNTGDHDSKDRFADTDIERESDGWRAQDRDPRQQLHENKLHTGSEILFQHARTRARSPPRRTRLTSLLWSSRLTLMAMRVRTSLSTLTSRRARLIDGLGTKAYKTDLHGNTPYTYLHRARDILLKHAEQEPDHGRRLQDWVGARI